MRTRTNNALILIGAIAGLMLFGTMYWMGNTQPRPSGLLIEVMFGTLALVFFFCFWIYGVIARFMTFLMNNPLHGGPSPLNTHGPDKRFDEAPYLSKKGFQQRELQTQKFFKLLGIFVCDPESETF